MYVCTYIHFKFYTVEYVINYLINGCNIKVGCGRDYRLDICRHYSIPENFRHDNIGYFGIAHYYQMNIFLM